MRVNAFVSLRENFHRRLRAYVKITYPGVDTSAVLRDCYNTEPTVLPEARALRAILTPPGEHWSQAWIPNKREITTPAKNHFYIRLLWRMQRVAEDHVTANRGFSTRGVHSFSLFPVSTRYTAAHITVNGTTLGGMCSRITKRLPSGSRCDIARYWGLDADIYVSAESFGQHMAEVMRKAFDVDAFETQRPTSPLSKARFQYLPIEEKYAFASHLFANQVSTDGYSASVLLRRPMNEMDGVERQRGEPTLQGRLLPEGYAPDVIIGLDPGMRSLCTAVREQYPLPQDAPRRFRNLRRRFRCTRMRVRKRKRRRRKKRYRCSRKWVRRYIGPRHSHGREVVEVHLAEYRHLAGFRKQRAWERGLRQRHLEYAETIWLMPSFKTSRYAWYLERLAYFWQHAAFLLGFCWEKPFRKWRFTNTQGRQIALDAVAARVVPIPSQRTCVAFGNWTFRGGTRGHPAPPIMGLRRALAKRAKVVIMNEFMTSKICSTCHSELSVVSYFVDTNLAKKRKRNGKVLPRAYNPSVWRECHSVLRCEQPGCEASLWNRDVNAAINIVNLLKYNFEHRGGRISVFAGRAILAVDHASEVVEVRRTPLTWVSPV